MNRREQRVAQNQALGRAINERIERHEQPATGEVLALVCECADADCSEKIELTWERYEQLRTGPHCFVVVEGHEASDLEVVIGREGDYLVVEKVEPGRQISGATDPRSN